MKIFTKPKLNYSSSIKFFLCEIFTSGSRIRPDRSKALEPVPLEEAGEKKSGETQCSRGLVAAATERVVFDPQDFVADSLAYRLDRLGVDGVTGVLGEVERVERFPAPRRYVGSSNRQAALAEHPRDLR